MNALALTTSPHAAEPRGQAVLYTADDFPEMREELNIIASLMPPSGGEVYYADKPVTGIHSEFMPWREIHEKQEVVL